MVVELFASNRTISQNASAVAVQRLIFGKLHRSVEEIYSTDINEPCKIWISTGNLHINVVDRMYFRKETKDVEVLDLCRQPSIIKSYLSNSI